MAGERVDPGLAGLVRGALVVAHVCGRGGGIDDRSAALCERQVNGRAGVSAKLIRFTSRVRRQTAGSKSSRPPSRPSTSAEALAAAVALVDSAGPVDGVCVEQGAYRPLVGEVELGGEGASADVADALGGGLRRVRVDVAMSGAA
ncbi:hypothetical protein [Streptomyces stelliscabiei]|uniref:hypothetical protein n=1 Tax=Streptomyces stelliscabiei TaxID=146820 RepID=UPI002FF0F430